jgi:hypothetical protein
MRNNSLLSFAISCPRLSLRLEKKMTDEEYYIEPKNTGGFSVKKTGAKRASAVTRTQAAAIEIAKDLDPEKKPHIARVRQTKAGKKGTLRKTP